MNGHTAAFVNRSMPIPSRGGLRHPDRLVFLLSLTLFLASLLLAPAP